MISHIALQYSSSSSANHTSNRKGPQKLKVPKVPSATNSPTRLAYTREGFVTDITEDILHNQIAKNLGIKYHFTPEN